MRVTALGLPFDVSIPRPRWPLSRRLATGPVLRRWSERIATFVLFWFRIGGLVLAAGFGSLIVRGVTAALCAAAHHPAPAWIR